MPAVPLDTIPDADRMIVAKVIAEFQRKPNPKCGVIVAEYDHEGYATRYWHRTKGWIEFGDERRREEPHVFLNVKVATRRADKESRLRPDETIKPSFWVHPSIQREAIEPYNRMRGGRWSPNQ